MSTIRDTPPHSSEYALAQLRHAYEHLMAERVIEQRMLAQGLIAPAIEYLEGLRDADEM